MKQKFQNTAKAAVVLQKERNALNRKLTNVELKDNALKAAKARINELNNKLMESNKKANAAIKAAVNKAKENAKSNTAAAVAEAKRVAKVTSGWQMAGKGGLAQKKAVNNALAKRNASNAIRRERENFEQAAREAATAAAARNEALAKAAANRAAANKATTNKAAANEAKAKAARNLAIGQLNAIKADLRTLGVPGVNTNYNVTNTNTLTNIQKKRDDATKVKKDYMGIPIVVGIVNPGAKNGTVNLDSNKYARNKGFDGYIVPGASFTQNNYKNVGGMSPLFDPSYKKSSAILLMGSSGSGKTHFANMIKAYLNGNFKLTSTTYFGGAFMPGPNGNKGFIQSSGDNGQEVAPFGLSHAWTPFNPDSSRVQTVMRYTAQNGSGKTIDLIDMAGNEDVIDLYMSFLPSVKRADAALDIASLLFSLSRSRSISKGTYVPELKITSSTAPGNIIKILRKHGSGLNTLYANLASLGQLSVKAYESKKAALPKGFILQEYAAACYIAARLSEGIYITSTIRTLGEYLNAVKVQKKAGKTTGVSVEGVISRKNIFINRGNATSNFDHIKTVLAKIHSQRAPAYSLANTNGKTVRNLFLSRVSQSDNLALLGVMYAGSDSKKRVLGKKTANTLSRLITINK